VLAVASDNLPATQSVHIEAPEVENFPMTQSVHDVDEVRLVNFPAAQLSQVLTPPNENVPAAHAVQPVDAEVPTDLVPAEQLVHVDWPVKDV
jgi:hypothetical protein